MSLRWRIVGILCAIAFVLYIDRVNITVAIPRISSEFGFSREQAGAVLSAFLFGYALGLAPGGWLADRFGPYRVLIGAGVAWTITTALTGCLGWGFTASLGSPVASFVAIRFLLGLCEACAYPTFNRAAANWMPAGERGRVMGVINGCSAIGGSATPPLIAYVISHYGWREAFFFAAAVTVLVTVWWARSASGRPEDHPAITAAELRLIRSGSTATRMEPPDALWYRRALRSKSTWILCISHIFFGLSIFVYVTWFYTYFVEVRNAGAMYSAVLSSLPYIAMAASAPAGGILSDLAVRRWGMHHGRRIVPAVALALAAGCVVAAPRISNHTASAVVFAMAAGLQYLAAGPFWAAVLDLSGRGAGLLGGVMNGFGQLGQAVGTLLFPLLVAQMGWESALQFAGLGSILSCVAWFFIDTSQSLDEAR